MSSKEFSMSDVAAHTDKKDLYVVLHDEVYNASSFVDEHPGGEEVLMDVGGQDATEAFEDVGHSDEAREILKGLHIGALKQAETSKSSNIATQAAKVQQRESHAAFNPPGSIGVATYAIVIVGVAVAFAAYQYLQASQKKSIL